MAQLGGAEQNCNLIHALRIWPLTERPRAKLCIDAFVDNDDMQKCVDERKTKKDLKSDRVLKRSGRLQCEQNVLIVFFLLFIRSFFLGRQGCPHGYTEGPSGKFYERADFVTLQCVFIGETYVYWA